MSLKLVETEKFLKPTFLPAVIFLLNPERVLAEIAELAKLHISEILKVESTAVTVDLELVPGGKVIPTFNVDVPNVGALEKQFVQKGIAEVWLGWAKQELVDRLRGLREVRDYDITKKNSSHASSETSEEKSSEETIPEN